MPVLKYIYNHNKLIHHSLHYCPLSLCLAKILAEQIQTVTTTTTTNTTGVESNPSCNAHSSRHNSLQFPHPSLQYCLTCSAPVLVRHSSHSSPTVRQVQRILIAYVPMSPASVTLPHSPSRFSVAHAAENLLFNSLQHQPINSFADGWLVPAGAG